MVSLLPEIFGSELLVLGPHRILAVFSTNYQQLLIEVKLFDNNFMVLSSEWDADTLACNFNRIRNSLLGKLDYFIMIKGKVSVC